MKPHSTRGFTLIELMVALVVAGLLMGVLVGLSGAVQRSFGFSKDITELQANLRFAMRILVDDLSRVAFMASPDPNEDWRHRPDESNNACPPYPTNIKAIEHDSGTGEITMRGNYISTRDYRRHMDDGVIRCRNKDWYDPAAPPKEKCGGYEPYFWPFADGPNNIDGVFCPGQWVRLDASGDGRYCYYQVSSVGADDVQFTQIVRREHVQGEYKWISPITLVRYLEIKDDEYNSPYSSGSDARFRYILTRVPEVCLNGELKDDDPVDVAEFLLPQEMGGFVLEQILDTEDTANLKGDPWQPAIGSIEPLADPVNVVQLRGLAITLRGRVEAEDPDFTIEGYTEDFPYLNFGVDLDGHPSNGLARVRVQRTVVDLRNMAL